MSVATGSLSDPTLPASTGQKPMSGSLPVVLASDELAISVLGTAAALNADALVSTDTSGYKGASIQIDGTFVGTLSFQGSNNATTWLAVQAANLSLQATPPVTTTAAAGLFYIPLNFRYLRIRFTAYTSGTATLTAVLSAFSATDLKARNAVLYGTYSSAQVPVAVDADGKIAVTSTLVSSIPAAQITATGSVNTGATAYTSYTATQKLAIKQFYAAGTGIGKQELFVYSPSTLALAPNGGFNTTGEIAAWPYTTTGASGTVVALNTTTKIEGAGAVSISFTTSDANHDHVLTYTYPAIQDISSWRYLTAYFYHGGPVGATFTRTVQITITDSNASTRTYQISGSTALAPWNAAGWLQIVGDIENPTAISGTAFDTTAVVSIKLRFFDSASRTSTCLWDQVRFEAMLTPVFPIYHPANTSFNIAIDPVVVLNIGDQVLIAQKNNDTTRKEYFAVASGVAI